MADQAVLAEATGDIAPSHHITLGWLETFLCVVDNQLNLERAGKELGIDPKTVMEQMIKIETWFSRPLISDGRDKGFYEDASELTFISINVLEEFDKNRLMEGDEYCKSSDRDRLAVSIHDLNILIGVAASKNRATAANDLGTSESAISRSLKKLSRALNNHHLFQGRSELSPSGVSMVESAANIVQRLSKFRRLSTEPDLIKIIGRDPLLEFANSINRKIIYRRVTLNNLMSRLAKSKKGKAYVTPRIEAVKKQLAMLDRVQQELIEYAGSPISSSAAHLDMDEFIQ